MIAPFKGKTVAPASGPTDAQRSALRWLLDHNGDGLFDRNGVFVAAGCKAPVMRATWNGLASLGLVELYQNAKRLRLTAEGRAIGERATLNIDHADAGWPS